MADLTQLLAPFDQSLIEQKQNMSYIGHEHIRLRVIQATDNQFDWEVTSVDYRTDGVVRDRQNKQTGEMFSPQVMIVTGKLTIPGLGIRTGMGVQVLEGGAGEDAYKGAESDAFKRAAMAFGVALEQLYVNHGASAPPSQERRQPTQQRPPVNLQDRVQQNRSNWNPEAKESATPGSMTQPQERAIFGIGKAIGYDGDTVKKLVYQRYSVDSMTKLTKVQAGDMIEFLQGEKAKIDSAPLGQGEFAAMDATIDRAAQYRS